MKNLQIIQRHPARILADGHSVVHDYDGIEIGLLPGRKRPSLCFVRGNEMTCSYAPIASFVSEVAAEELARWLSDAFPTNKQEVL